EECEFLTLAEGPLRVCPIPDQRRGFFTPRNRRVGPKSYVRYGPKADIVASGKSISAECTGRVCGCDWWILFQALLKLRHDFHGRPSVPTIAECCCGVLFLWVCDEVKGFG